MSFERREKTIRTIFSLLAGRGGVLVVVWLCGGRWLWRRRR